MSKRTIAIIFLMLAWTISCRPRDEASPSYYQLKFQKQLEAKKFLAEHFASYRGKLQQRGIKRIWQGVSFDKQYPNGREVIEIEDANGKLVLDGPGLPFILYGSVEIITAPFSVTCTYNETLLESGGSRDEFGREWDRLLAVYDELKETKGQRGKL